MGKIPLSGWGEVTLAAKDGLLEESRWVELKEMLPPGKDNNRELVKDLAALYVEGGVLIFGSQGR